MRSMSKADGYLIPMIILPFGFLTPKLNLSENITILVHVPEKPSRRWWSTFSRWISGLHSKTSQTAPASYLRSFLHGANNVASVLITRILCDNVSTECEISTQKKA